MSGERTVRVDTGGSGAREFLGSLANRVRIAAKDHGEAREAARAKAAGPSVAERQEELVRFYDHYEELVEIVCDAAQYGPAIGLQSRYEQQRDWIRREYPAVKPFLAGFLRYSEDDAQGGAPVDAFEALSAAPTLEEALRADDGRVIGRITRTREALNLYGEHLRQLVARKR